MPRPFWSAHSSVTGKSGSSSSSRPEVVGVGEAHVAVTVGDRVQHVRVGAEDVWVVGHPAAQHALGGRAAVLGETVGHERDVVLAGPGAQAEAALPARVAEALVGGHLAGPDTLGGAHDRPRAQGEAVPGRPDAHSGDGVADLIGSRARLLGAPQVGGVDRDQDVGGRVLALGLEPLVELGRVAAADRAGRCRSPWRSPRTASPRRSGSGPSRSPARRTRSRDVARITPTNPATSSTVPPMTVQISFRRDIRGSSWSRWSPVVPVVSVVPVWACRGPRVALKLHVTGAVLAARRLGLCQAAAARTVTSSEPCALG